MSLEHFQNGMKDLISNKQSRRFIMKSTREREREKKKKSLNHRRITVFPGFKVLFNHKFQSNPK